MTAATVALGLMAKPPRPGLAKTRLAAGIGPEAAAAFARAFLLDTARVMEAAAATGSLACSVLFRPDDAANELAALLARDWPLIPCDQGDLGATMWWALDGLLAQHPAGAMIMGADLPLVPPGLLVEAAAILRRGGPRDVVVMPTADGGYGLIGVTSEAAAPLFAPLPWSTPVVLDETLRRAAAGGLTVHRLAEQRDIDDAGDLVWLRQALAAAPDTAPATRAALADFDRDRPRPGPAG